MIIGSVAGLGLLAMLLLSCGCGDSTSGMIRPLPRTTGAPMTPHHHGSTGGGPAAPPPAGQPGN